MNWILRGNAELFGLSVVLRVKQDKPGRTYNIGGNLISMLTSGRVKQTFKQLVN